MRIGRGMVTALAAFALAAGTARAQEPTKRGPEYDVLKSQVGTWDATVEMSAMPGQAPSVSKGVETNTMIGGLWLITDFKSEMAGEAFQGHGVAGYDPDKKKYVSTWVDSTMTALNVSDSAYDAATKTMTGSMQMPDASGKLANFKMVTEWKDADTRQFTIWGPGPDGKEWAGLKITYKRRK
jgi:uncharacterized protein affecting Mg2+/Co2+ transport